MKGATRPQSSIGASRKIEKDTRLFVQNCRKHQVMCKWRIHSYGYMAGRIGVRNHFIPQLHFQGHGNVRVTSRWRVEVLGLEMQSVLDSRPLFG